MYDRQQNNINMCSANSYEFVTYYAVELLLLEYFQITEVVQNVIDLTLKLRMSAK